jgi:hypothetical protein
MPVEIKELQITAVVEGQGNKEKPEPQAATNMEKIIAECVEQVLKILQQKNER